MLNQNLTGLFGPSPRWIAPPCKNYLATGLEQPNLVLILMLIYVVFKPLYNDLLDQSLSDHAHNALWVMYITVFIRISALLRISAHLE